MKSEIDGSVKAPASKSMMIRAVAAAALAEGKSTITNPSLCEDGLAAIACARELGARIAVREDCVTVEGGIRMKRGVLDCGESGLCIRMLAPIVAAIDGNFTLTGRGSLLKRQMGMMQQPLEELGAKCSTNNGMPPVKVQGQMRGEEIEIDCSQSSQFLTGLLMALPLCDKDSLVRVKNLKSKPYVKMTLELLREFEIAVTADWQLGEFAIKGGQHFKPADYEVEGDWSGAAFLLVAGAIAGKVEVRGLRNDSLQGDKAIVEALKKAGAKVKLSSDAVTVGSAPLSSFEFDATDCPDLFPPLAVLACNCKGTSRIWGAERLKGKESDRGAALASELGELGAEIAVRGDEMLVAGTRLRGGVKVDSHNDHRIAMACAVAALKCEGGVEIGNAECVSKSYPRFFHDLDSLRVG
ncbi:MAG: 3-phosphoshikimate 1-carboxyvinyltransferase [Candidatus Anstonellaceae archaeon]